MVLIPVGFRESLVERNSRDQIVAGTNPNNFGSSGNDVIGGHTLSDVLLGQEGNDRIVGNGGADIITGDQGSDTLVGGTGRDTLLGGDDNDRVDGGRGNDIVIGGSGDDTLFGRRGNDRFDGGIGNDLIIGGNGSDDVHYTANILTDDGVFLFSHTEQPDGSSLITDSSGALGTDTLQSIESIKFDDFTVNLNGENNAPIAQIRAALISIGNRGMIYRHSS